MNTNKKLVLNKQLMANLNEVKGGDREETRYNFSQFFIECYLSGKIVDYLITQNFNNRGECCEYSELCTNGCSDNCSHTCFSAAKCA